MKPKDITPELDPEEFRQLGYRAVDLLVEQLSNLQNHNEPARRYMPDDLRREIMVQPLPEKPGDPHEILDAVAENVMPYPLGNVSPRFFARVTSSPAPLGVIADLLASGLGSNAAGGHHAATYIEHAVLNWIKQLLDFPGESAGLITSGGSGANLIALGVMRSEKAEGNMRAKGFQQPQAPMVVYTSTQGHSCLQKAVEVLGIGNDFLRKIPTDADYRMDMTQLKNQIRQDRADGLRPVCVAATAGTTNVGSIDPLEEIADLCAEENMWFHVDGAYGAPGMLCDEVRHLYQGLQRADSLVIDPHKWLYAPIECGCVLVRDAGAMRETYSLIPPYLRDDRKIPWFSDFGVQQTRGFKALKLWMMMQHLGAQGYREMVTRNIQLTRRFQQMIREQPDFELMTAGPLSVTCFRFVPPGVSDLNSLNRQLLEKVQLEGRVFLTSTELEGQLLLRTCIVNFRTDEDDLQFLLTLLAEAGHRVMENAAD
jgi:glutamate/tyrosine decarboxylase-like PLP-dependent enzyme